MTIRDERPEDVPAVREVNRLAFNGDLEANIVDALRTNGAALLSLVAAEAGRVVGHIMFSPVFVATTAGAALGPMAVHPERQRQGVGRALVETGVGRLRERGLPFIVVVGHPGYYPRFGFTPARPHGIGCVWDVPDDVFMLRVLDPVRMAGLSGMAVYRREFSTVT